MHGPGGCACEVHVQRDLYSQRAWNADQCGHGDGFGKSRSAGFKRDRNRPVEFRAERALLSAAFDIVLRAEVLVIEVKNTVIGSGREGLLDIC